MKEKILEAINEIGCRLDDELDFCRISLRDADNVLKGSKFVLAKLEEHVKNFKEDLARKAKMNNNPTQQQVQQNLINEIALQQIANLVQIAKNENILNEKTRATKESELATITKTITIVKKYYDETETKLTPPSEPNEIKLETDCEKADIQVDEALVENTEQIVVENTEQIVVENAIEPLTEEKQNADQDSLTVELSNIKENQIEKKEKKTNSIVELSRQIRDKKKSKKSES